MSQHQFTRRDGSSFVIELSIDPAKVAEDMAHKLIRTGAKTAKKLSGAVVATIVKDSR